VIEMVKGPIEYNTLAENYDLEGLEQLYREYSETGTEVQKRELAEEGFLELLNNMDFDFSFGKLTETGIELMLPIVEKAEKLLGKTLWYQRGRAYSVLTQTRLKHSWETARKYGESAINAYLEAIEAGKQVVMQTEDDLIEGFSAHRSLAEIYSIFAEADAENRLEWWRQALHWTEKTIELDPLGSYWVEYLKLLYWPYGKEEVSFDELRERERERFRRMTREFAGRVPGLAYQLASEYKRFWDRLEWHHLDTAIFPAADYFDWLEKAKDWPGRDNNLDLSEMAHLYHNEGNRLQRRDLLWEALQRYQWMIGVDRDSAFPVLYTANTLESLANLCRAEGKLREAGDYLNKAQGLFEKHLKLVKSNFSVLIQYAEFLERCTYEYAGHHHRPKLQNILGLALEAERIGEGFYAGPGFLLARCALRQWDGQTAVFHLTRLLLLHELCLEEDFRKLQDAPLFTGVSEVRDFITESLKFMASIRESYYLHQTMPWKQLEPLSPAQVTEAWQARRVALVERKLSVLQDFQENIDKSI